VRGVDRVAHARQEVGQWPFERERLRVALNCCILTENVRKSGYGDMDLERLGKMIAIISKAYNLPRQPAVAEVFDSSYLPPLKDRMIR